MRNKKLAFLAGALVAATGLLAAPAAMATNNSCSTTNTITYEGPCAVNSLASPDCLPAGTQGAYTAIRYDISSSDHISNVGVLVTSNNYPNDLFVGNGFTVAAPCRGDTPTALGKNSCHEVAVRVNPNASTRSFWVVVSGQKQVRQTTLAVKANGCTKYYPVPGLGEPPPVPPVAPVTETLTDGGCSVVFTLDAISGTVLAAKLTPESLDAGCESPDSATDGTLDGKPAAALELFLNGRPLGKGKFGSGYFNTGANSCTTRVIGGRVYTWGNPCPER